MGGMTSCFRKQHNRGAGIGYYNSTPKIHGHKRNLSATFNIPDMMADSDVIMEQLNVNIATEEELMTLPGVDRQTAHNIIEYRQQIGHFRKIEDLALVSGVGATKLNQIRFEICVGRRKNSQNSSPCGSKHDLSNDRSSTRSTPVRVNINTSNVFQLMKVKSISQYIAENIVAYRDKKGHFNSMDDLVKVKGIKSGMLSAIRPYLILGSDNAAQLNQSNGSVHLINSSQSSFKYLSDPISFPATPLHSQLLLNEVSNSVEDLLSVYGPLAKKSERVDIGPFKINEGSKPVIRIATWNLQRFSSQKANNPGVKEVICMTLLEQGISVLSVQELVDEEALLMICNELNNPTLPKVKKWTGDKKQWSCVTSEEAVQSKQWLGFLYDTSLVKLLQSGPLEKLKDSSTQSAKQPFIATFKIGLYDMVLVNALLKSPDVSQEDQSKNKEGVVIKLPDLVTALNHHLSGDKEVPVVVLGNFNLDPEDKEFEVFHNNGLTSVVPASVYTDISLKNKEGSKSFDNFWLSNSALKYHTECFEVVRGGLSSPWIPDGWSWGGLVSNHCPVWIEFYLEPLNNGHISQTVCQ